MKTEKQMAMATAEFAERWKGTGNVSQSVRHIVSITSKRGCEQKHTSSFLYAGSN